MNVKIVRGAEVNRPTPKAITSSVLDHATVVSKPDFGLRNNAGLWPTYNCLDLLVPTPTCADPLEAGEDDEPVFKQFSVAGWVPAFEFAVHGGVQCSAVGLDRDDQRAEVERVFAASEGKGVERALVANRFVDRVSDADNPVEWDGAIEVMPGTVPVATAIAMLEGYAAIHYAGVPTLHLPRAVVTLAFGLGLLREEGGLFYTKTGSKVAAGGGYDGQGTAAEWDLYATGEVYVERSEEVSIQAFTMPGDGSGTGEGENGLEPNTSIALVERMFRVGVDCFVAKIRAGASTEVSGGGGGAGLVDNGDGTWSVA